MSLLTAPSALLIALLSVSRGVMTASSTESFRSPRLLVTSLKTCSMLSDDELGVERVDCAVDAVTSGMLLRSSTAVLYAVSAFLRSVSSASWSLVASSFASMSSITSLSASLIFSRGSVAVERSDLVSSKTWMVSQPKRETPVFKPDTYSRPLAAATSAHTPNSPYANACAPRERAGAPRDGLGAQHLQRVRQQRRAQQR
mmetsp:Transcript_8138/g.25729  ORF Transcript_8138/g.25729 Transcript_8138/m.25729 type:complete len:200 (+) Transcript_8138:1137-1736(+)